MPVEMSSLIDDPRQLVLAAFGCALTQEDDLYCWGLKPEFPRFFMSTWGRCEPAVQRVRTYED